MNYLVDSKQMKYYDSYTIRTKKVPSAVLMERAALSVVKVLQEHYCTDRVLVLCGSGNNGGDGFAVARLLKTMGLNPAVYFCGDPGRMTPDAALQKEIYLNYGGAVCTSFQPECYTVVVDALFGIGLSGEVTGEKAEVIRKLNGSGVKTVAVDIPSGVNADHGAIEGIAVMADSTVTFGYGKTGQFLYPGREYCGTVFICDIGIYAPDPVEEAGRESVSGETEQLLRDPVPSRVFTLTEDDLLRILPMRMPRSNKGTYGKTLLVGGNINMAGAIALSARAAGRCGCGLVKVLSHPENRTILQSLVPEALFGSWTDPEAVSASLRWADVVAIGPGLGTSSSSRDLLELILKQWKGTLVLDADALNLIAEDPSMIKETDTDLIITPHPGEMSRLCGTDIRQILNRIPDTAKAYAADHGLVCVLKDAATVTSDGTSVCINSSGCDALATGGSGDVLTGMIASLAAQGMRGLEAASAGVFLHGLAGEAAALQRGSRSVIAWDLTEALDNVLKSY